MTVRSHNVPWIGITLGDPAGIGPEVAVRTALDARVKRRCRPLLLGDARVVSRALEQLERSSRVATVEDIPPGDSKRAEGLMVLDIPAKNLKRIRAGKLSASAGRAAYDWVVRGADLALAGRLAGLVTAPLNKAAVQKADVLNFRGHTELLAQRSGVRRFAMMLAGGGLRVTLVTTHVAIERIVGELTEDNILEKIELTRDFLIDWGIAEPRLAVAALNPHAGERGGFGREEIEIIEPAIRKARRMGKKPGHLIGPLPADTLFAAHVRDPFDAVVVMYHDQGLIPLKLLSFGKGVNITLGLPFVRTSPDHGTAFDLAGTGTADPGSMIEAVLTAVRLANNRREKNPG